jgi:hypothetical protein
LPLGVQYTSPPLELEELVFFVEETLTVQTACFPELIVTVILAEPFFLAVIFPLLETLTTFLLLDFHRFTESPLA